MKGSPEQTQRHSVPASGVQGFDLEYKNIPPNRFPFFTTGYAVWANYPYFTHDGKTYERAGVGGVVIRFGDIRPTRYQVTETVDAWAFGSPSRSRLTIYDKNTGSIVATRVLRQGEIENQMGWVGQHAAEFVRRFLLTDEPIGAGGVGTKSYPQASVKISPEEMPSLPEQSSTCPSSVTSMLIAGARSIGRHDWQFIPQQPIDDFACAGGKIIVLSGIFPSRLYLDLLTQEGVNEFQTNIRFPVFSVYSITKISKSSLSNNSIHLHISFLKAKNIHGDPTEEPDRYFKVTIPIIPSSGK
jgi:hypothetical protein